MRMSFFCIGKVVGIYTVGGEISIGGVVGAGQYILDLVEDKL